LRPETELAIRAARIAQEIADSRRGADRITSKGGIDLVTETDVACEDAIRAELIKTFPDYAVIGEERHGKAAPGQPYWLVDPICGTRPFASDIPLYCTNIALVENGEVTVAAVGVGKTREVLYAEHRRGARLRSDHNDAPIAANDRSNTVWIDGRTERAADALKRAVLSKRWYVWQFSSSLAYAYVACGRIAGALQFSTSRPLHGSVHGAAGCFIAREAGALVADLDDAGPWKLTTSSFVIAATVELQKDLLSLVEPS